MQLLLTLGVITAALTAMIVLAVKVGRPAARWCNVITGTTFWQRG